MKGKKDLFKHGIFYYFPLSKFLFKVVGRFLLLFLPQMLNFNYSQRTEIPVVCE